MRPAGRVLETPDIHKLKTVNGDRTRHATSHDCVKSGDNLTHLISADPQTPERMTHAYTTYIL